MEAVYQAYRTGLVRHVFRTTSIILKLTFEADTRKAYGSRDRVRDVLPNRPTRTNRADDIEQSYHFILILLMNNGRILE